MGCRAANGQVCISLPAFDCVGKILPDGGQRDFSIPFRVGFDGKTTCRDGGAEIALRQPGFCDGG